MSLYQNKMVQIDQLRLLIDCLIDTVERTTDLDSIYNEKDGTSISWGEVEFIREGINSKDFPAASLYEFMEMSDALVDILLERDNVKLKYEYDEKFDNWHLNSESQSDFEDYNEEAEGILYEIGIRIKT